MRCGSAKLTMAGALAVLAAAVGAAAGETAHVTYSLSLVGLPVGTAAVGITYDGRSYAVDSKGSVGGVAAVVSRAKGAASGHGMIVDGRLSPSDFATTATNSSMTRTIRMTLSGNAVGRVDVSPPFEDKPDRIPVAERDRRGVIDPASAFLFASPGGGPLVGPAACNRTLPIFDGNTRFDLALTYAGQREVQTKGYKGPVAVCSARYRPISGHRPDRPATKFMVENRDLELWLAPWESAHVLLPYRVSVRTMIGTVVAEASEFSAPSK